jgi:HlyD family secretion protein
LKKILNRKTVGGFFLAALLLLVFFSKTIHDYNLPDVTAVEPEKGTLSKLEISSGIADWAQVENIYAAVGGTVEEVLVKEGEQVKAGQELFRMEFDRDEAERKLAEIENNCKKLQIDIQEINLKLDQLKQAGSAGGEHTDYELSMIEMDIKKTEAELQEAELLYEYGEITQRELETAQDALQALYLKRDNKLAEDKTQQDDLQFQLQAKKVDLANLELQEEPYRKLLEEYDEYAVITAPADGFLLTLNAEKGLSINENALTASIGVGNEFAVECSISLDNNFVIPGDACRLDNSSHRFDGTVTYVTPRENGKTVQVSIVSDDVSAGETFDITFKKESTTTYTLIPNGALNQDNDGYFLNQIKRREGIMGDEYYIERLDVFIGDSDSENTAIVQGITFFEPVMLVSDKPVTAGDVVSLENAGDFFED